MPHQTSWLSKILNILVQGFVQWVCRNTPPPIHSFSKPPGLAQVPHPIPSLAPLPVPQPSYRLPQGLSHLLPMYRHLSHQIQPFYLARYTPYSRLGPGCKSWPSALISSVHLTSFCPSHFWPLDTACSYILSSAPTCSVHSWQRKKSPHVRHHF